ncbi:MAG TPA: serine hydrolase domain-containing protein [Ferruginibacter sp.]|nr:serine hydrolase domain-containing protein [Ferruginibacter sp.]HMP20890.1 serine hydrolase domain-containing protein [Ferruginibacter sp.]
MLICLVAKAQFNFAGADAFITTHQKALGGDIATLVYKDGAIIFRKETGTFNSKTVAPIASCSKWLTAALVMTFVDEGKISLDQKVSDFLPIFETYGKTYITLRQCLSHTTGIADKGLLARLIERRKFETLEEEINNFVKREIADNPGKSFYYGNVGLNIAARVLEVVSKKSFETLMRQRIFIPLEMKQSSFAADNAPNPSGGAASTANDYMNFLSMILNKGMYKEKRILSEKAITEMQRIHTKEVTKKYSPKVAEGFEYGLGLWILEQDNNGNSTVVASPGLFGTFPYVDIQRNYACIIFIKKFITEERKELYIELKKKIDAAISQP